MFRWSNSRAKSRLRFCRISPLFIKGYGDLCGASRFHGQPKCQNTRRWVEIHDSVHLALTPFISIPSPKSSDILCRGDKFSGNLRKVYLPREFRPGISLDKGRVRVYLVGINRRVEYQPKGSDYFVGRGTRLFSVSTLRAMRVWRLTVAPSPRRKMVSTRHADSI